MASALSERRLRIREGLHFTAVQGEGVILDLVEDRYWGLYDVSSTIWRGLLEGLDRVRLVAALGEAHDLPLERAAQTLDAQLTAWLECRLLLPDAGCRDARVECPTKPPGVPAREDLETRAPWKPGFGSATKGLVLLRAKSWAIRQLRRRRLDDALAELACGAAYEDRMWPDLLRTLAAYRWLRRVFFRQDDCLPRTLVLARALQLQEIPYDICFGVRKIPLRAHAWLEVRGISVLDPAEHLAAFSVIARF